MAVERVGDAQKTEGFTVVPDSYLAALRRDHEILQALYTCGVENWEWYDDAIKDVS